MDKLRIFQINTRKSPDAHGKLINTLSPNDWDIIAIQEPALNSVENIQATRHWQVFYPCTKPNKNHPRLHTVTLVNARISHCMQINVTSSDIVGIYIGQATNQTSIYNIYNNGTNNDMLKHLAAHLEGQQPSKRQAPSIWLGNFNRHHHMWEGKANGHLRSSPDKITLLLELVIEHGMQQLLPVGIPTRIENRSETHPDNVWASEGIVQRMVECNTWPEWRPNTTDHVPIVTIIDTNIPRSQEEAQPNYKQTNWEKFCKGIEGAIRADKTLSSEPRSVEEMEATIDALTSHLQIHLKAMTPTSKTSRFQKPWWSDKCKEAHRRKCTAYAESRRWWATPDHPSHQAYRVAQDKMKRTVRASKEEHWWNWIDNANDSNLWNINRFQKQSNSDGSRERVPPLKSSNSTLAQLEEEKAAILAEAFFPPPPSLAPAKPILITGQLPKWSPYTVERIR
ncbi:hypothetical protein PIIN_08813 [Serendipita indica DSM 11827]|uniref:Endonuclease/exonuclease/phosphatase domain-containing protein n=1 Tax=Serendipita indica (strain DSM 11827) TaxID=1109443 RepID=G4TU51_SERID|nr:hypothetical protein PIIN_08813 [Serendipita indica DSM 11827]